MFGLTRTSVLPITSLSITVSHLAANDPVSALYITFIACFCLILVAAVTVVCEFAKWKLRRYLRERELADAKNDQTDVGI